MNPTHLHRTLPLALALSAALGACTGDTTGPGALGPELVTAAAAEAALESAGMEALLAQDSITFQTATDAGGEGAGTDPQRHRDVRPRLMVAMGRHAVALATRLVGVAPGPEQLLFLQHATEAQRGAEAALAAGHPGRAATRAHRALVTSLKAVVVPDGVTEEEARAMAALDNELMEEARAAVGVDPQAHEAMLLRVAHRLHELGLVLLGEGHLRGVAFLWRSAVISALLIG